MSLADMLLQQLLKTCFEGRKRKFRQEKKQQKDSLSSKQLCKM